MDVDALPVDGSGRRRWQDADLARMLTEAAAGGRLEELVAAPGFLAFADPDRLAEVLGALDRGHSPVARVYWRALDRLREAATPAARAGVLQAVALAEEPAAVEELGLAGYAGWTPLWSAGDGLSAFHRRLAGPEEGVRAVAFGRFWERSVLAAAGRDHTVRVWDARTGTPQATLTGHTDYVHELAFGLPGERAVLASGADDRTVRLWDPIGGELLHTLEVEAGEPSGLCFLRLEDGRDVLAVSTGNEHKYTGGVDLWDPVTGEHLRALYRGEEEIKGLTAFTLGGRPMLAATDLERLLVWDAATGEPYGSWEVFPDSEPCLVGGPAAGVLDGRPVLVLPGREDGPERHFESTVVLWDPAAGRAVRRIKLDVSERVLGVGTAGGETLLATTHETSMVRLWPLTGGPFATFAAHTGYLMAAAFGQVGDVPVVATADRDGAVLVWDVPARHRQSAEREARGLALHTEGERPTLVTLSRHASARLCDPASGEELGRLNLEHGDDFPYTDTAGGCLAAGTVGGRLLLATGGSADGVSLWDPAAGSVALVLEGLRKARAAAFGSGGDRELVAAGGGWDPAAVWDAVTGERLAVLHEGPRAGAWEVRAIAIATVRRRTVVACAGRSEITMWNGLTGAYMRSLPIDRDGTGLVMCPLGARVVLAAPVYGGVRLWDAGNGKRLAGLRGQGAPVTCLAGLPYGDRLLLVVGDDAGAVTLWEWDGRAETGRRVGVLALFARTVHAVAMGMVAGAPHVFAQSYADRVTACRLDPEAWSGEG